MSRDIRDIQIDFWCMEAGMAQEQKAQKKSGKDNQAKVIYKGRKSG